MMAMIIFHMFRLCLLVVITHATRSNAQNTPYVKNIVDIDNFQSFKNHPGVRLAYFYKLAKTKDTVHEQKLFFMEYEKSAQIIHVYDVLFAKVDCPSVPKYCDVEGIQNKVVVFRNGAELLTLDLENMFDMDSIVSNILQIVLLREVPILQHIEERNNYLDLQKGQNDVIFLYESVIGTHAHRVFMEIAFAYQSKYKFALTTEKKVVKNFMFYNEQDESSMWVLKCKDVHEKTMDCKQYRYWDGMELRAMAKFIKALEKPFVHELTHVNDVCPFIESDLHTVRIYFDDESLAGVRKEATDIITNFYGLLGICIVNVNRIKADHFGFDYERMNVPTLAFQYSGESTYNVMPHDLLPTVFVNNHLSKKMPAIFKRKTADGIPVVDVMSTDDDEEQPDDEIPDEDAQYQDSMSPEEVARMNELELIETQDDHVAAVVWKMRKVKLDRAYVPVLNDKTFYTEVKDRELLVVLFYVKFDPRGMAFLHHYVAASKDLAASDSLQQPLLAGVDCFDWTDVCDKVNVSSYPTVRIYRRDRDPVEYKGILSKDAVVSMVHLFLAKSPIHLKSKQEYSDFIGGNLPEDIHKHTDTAVIGLFDSEHKQELEVFKMAAEDNDGKLLFSYMVGEVAKEVVAETGASLPRVIVHRRTDDIQPQSVFSDDMFNREKLTRFITDQALLLFPELTVTNLPGYMARKKPLLILFTGTPHTHPRSLYSTLKGMVQSVHQLQFCWMNVSNPNSIAAKVLLDYNPVATPPAIALVNHAQGTVHMYSDKVHMNSNQGSSSAKHVQDWVTDVLNDNIKPTKMLDNREWKPRHPGYDFLKMIEEEKYGYRIVDDTGADNNLNRVEPMDLPDAQIRAELHQEKSRFRHKYHSATTAESTQQQQQQQPLHGTTAGHSNKHVEL